MKKLGKRIIALAAVAVMGLSMIACGKKSMADYVNSKEVQDVVKDLESQTSSMDMKIEITADGDKMVYTYTYNKIEKADGMAESLEAEMAKQDSVFQDTANELKKVVNAKSPSVVIEYVDCNGELIYSKEYVAK